MPVNKLERSVQSDIMRYAESNGWYVIKLIQTNKPGMCDLLFFKNGVSFLCETKQFGKDARPLQKYRMKELKKYGIHSFNADSLSEFVEKYRLFIDT